MEFTSVYDPDFLDLLYQSWSRETSSSDDWSEENPADGQCAVTALLVRDVFGHDVIRGKIRIGDKTISHYWNNDCDLTFNQFNPMIAEHGLKEIEITPPPDGMSAYDYCISNENTVQRYLLLKERFLDLKDQSNNEQKSSSPG